MNQVKPYQVISLVRKDVGGNAVETFGRQIDEAVNWWAGEGYAVQWAEMPSDRTFYALLVYMRPTPQTTTNENENEKGEAVEAAPVSTEA